MPIIFKVVTPKRESCYAPGLFMKCYNKGDIVKAVEGTVGIVCSRTRKQAEGFVTRSKLRKNLEVIRVRGIGKGRRILSFQGFFSISHIKWTMEIIKEHGIQKALRWLYPETVADQMSVVCYNSVEVLE